jgi:hypothetical protein
MSSIGVEDKALAKGSVIEESADVVLDAEAAHVTTENIKLAKDGHVSISSFWS